jgi:hypothetical protein
MPLDQHLAHSPERDSLRQSLGLRVVTVQEEGSSIRRLPNGIYGFTGAPATDEIPLFIKPIFECFEIHKNHDGVINWIGYVTELELRAFLDGSEPMMLDLYPEQHGDSKHLISVPATRVDRRRPPTRENGNSMRIEVSHK